MMLQDVMISRKFKKKMQSLKCTIVRGGMKKLLSSKFFPSNQLFSDLFSKCVAFTKFLPKKCDSEF